EQADYSTFLHETAHFYLTAMFQMAQMPQATQQMRDDVQTTLDWFGVKDLETWNNLSIDEQRRHHEAFAYNHEIYIFEGKAPSIKLQTLFDKFSAWLRRVYKSIRDDLNKIYREENGVDLPILTGEVRQVMDRMLASEDDIQRAAMVRDMVPIYQTQEQSGMSDTEWAAYQEMAKEARDAAIAQMTTSSLRQMKWLSNARSRILKAMQRETAEIRKDTRATVAAEVANEPVYRADRFIRRGELELPETANKEQRRIAAETGLKGTKLSLEALKEMYGEGPAAPWRYMPTGQYGLVATEGLHPDLVADLFGFSSGDQMVRELLSALPMKEAIDQRTDQRVLEENGDLSDPKAMQNAVEQALHNEARARFVAVELRHAAKATQPARLMIEAARRAAKRIIGGKMIRDVKASEYAIEEGRATKRAETAMKEGKSEAVTKALQGRLLNNQLAKMAADAVSEIDAGLRYLKRVQNDATRKRIGADYADQIDGILERFDLSKRSLKEIDRKTSLSDFIDDQIKNGIEPDISPEIKNAAVRKHYKNLTVDEFRDLIDAVKQIEHMGRGQQMLLTAAKQQAYEAARDEIVNSINANANGRTANPRTPTTNMGRWFQSVKRFYASHIKAASIARILDGGKEGPMWDYFIRTANERADRETEDRAKATEALTKILAPVFDKGKMGGKGIYFPSIERSLNREARLAIALNMGNEGNIQRLLGGENWTLEQITPVMQSLTKDELLAVQKIWDYFESYRPRIAEKERKLYGKEPKWVEPQSIIIKSADGEMVTLRGGYYPIKYDPQATEVAESHNEAEEAKRQLQGAYTSATTRRSFTKARVQEVTGRPLLYTLAGMYSGVNDVIHDLAWHEWLIDANKLLRSTAISESIRNQYGPEFHRQLKTWVQDVAAGERAVQNEGEIALNFLRQSVSMAGLGFNVMSALQQVTGFSSSMIRLGPAYMGRGIGKMISSPILATKEVNEKSTFMANRARTQFRELNELRNMVQDESSTMRAIRVGAYFMMARMQKMVDIPTWIGAYEKAIGQGNDEQRAIALADQAVIDTQGGGMLKDLSRIERGGAGMKLFTVFYSYMNTQFNIGVTEAMTEKSKARLAAKMMLLTIVPVVLTYALKKGLTPGDDDEWDWEKIAKELAAENISYLMGMMVILREFGEAGKLVVGAEGPGRSYGGPAGLRTIGDMYKFAQQVSQLEFDDAFRKAAINILGDFTGLPSAQINRTVNGVNALVEGETKNPAAVVLGYEQAR
ncbi:MAG: Bordetella virus, partial [Pseudomonadota bacterium]